MSVILFSQIHKVEFDDFNNFIVVRNYQKFFFIYHSLYEIEPKTVT